MQRLISFYDANKILTVLIDKGGYRFKQPLDNWSIREKLALACSVLRSGDQNWVSVSRTIKPLGESDRPEQWFSQKNCAQQYAELLETVETPKRKRGEKEKEIVETPQLVIARKLTLERIEQLRDVISQQQQQYNKLREEIEQINAGHFDKDLPELIKQIKEEEQAEEAKQTKEEKGDGDATLTPKTPMTPITEVKVKIEKEDDSMDTEDISVVEETVVYDSPVIVAAPTPETEPSPAYTVPHTPTPPPPAPQSPAKPVVVKEEPQSVENKTPVTPIPSRSPAKLTPIKTPKPPVIQEEKISLIKTEPPEDVEVDILAAETSDEGPHMTETPTVSVKEKEPVVSTKTEDTSVQKEAVTESSEEVRLPETPVSTPVPVPALQVVSISKDVDDNSPLSPASSIASHDTETPSVKKEHHRPGKSNRGRRSKGFKKKEERPLASEIETSDDDDKSICSTHLSFSESKHSPASHEDSDMDEKQYKVWKKSIILVWRSAANHKYAKLFLHPVTEFIAPGYSRIVHRYANVFMHPVKEDIAPGYKKIVLRPIDLQSIKKKIESGEIRSTVEFQRDIMLMFTNAMMYNSSDHDVYKMAMDMYNDVMNSIEQFMNTQAMMQSEATPTGKFLRQSRRSETVTLSGGERSDKEDEIKKRRQSIETEGGKAKKRKA